jgi:hypothetical protein
MPAVIDEDSPAGDLRVEAPGAGAAARGLGPFGHELHLARRPDRTFFERFPRGAEGRRVVPVVNHRQRHSGAPGGVLDANRLRQRAGEGLLDQHVQAGGDGLLHRLHVLRRGRGDVHEVQAFGGQARREVGVRANLVAGGAGRPLAGCALRIDHGADLESRVAKVSGKVPELRHSAEADQSSAKDPAHRNACA